MNLLIRSTYWTLWGLAIGIGKSCFRLRFIGQHNIPSNGSLLIAANHASFLDIPFLGCGIPRPLAFIGRHNLFPIPVINPVLQSLGWIPIRENRFDRGGFRRAEDVLRDGKAVVIFPEGARTETGALGEVKPGLAKLVANTKCQVLPAYISGTFEALPIGARRISFYPVTVVYGAPIDFSCQIEQHSKKEFYRHVATTVKVAIGDLASKIHGIRRGYTGVR